MMRREVVRDAARRADRRDGVLEDRGDRRRRDSTISAKRSKFLMRRFELDCPSSRMHGDGELLAPRVVQEHVLDVRRAGRFRLASAVAARPRSMRWAMRRPATPRVRHGCRRAAARGPGWLAWECDGRCGRPGAPAGRRRAPPGGRGAVGGTRRGRVGLTGEREGGVLGRQHHRNGIRNGKRNR